MRTLAGASLVLLGYTLTWWGWRRLHDCVGDLPGLIIPNRTAKPGGCGSANSGPTIGQSGATSIPGPGSGLAGGGIPGFG